MKMRKFKRVLPILLVVAGGEGALACDSKAEIEAAFTKQQKAPAWRTVITSETEAGKQEQTFEYIPPDKVYRKVLIIGQEPPIETIGIGQWAWSNQGSGWGELQPPIAKLISEQTKQTIERPPEVSASFSCLGKVTYEGKEYLGYQTAPEKGPDGVELARTIYVDPASGLPAFNVIAPVQDAGAAIRKEAFTYPADIVIEKPF